MKMHWMTAVLAAAVALTPALSTTVAAENTTAESSAVLTETSNDSMNASEAATSSSVQLPNPMVPYTSYSEMTAALGFRPLALPRAEGYELTNAFVIGGTVGDLRYTSRYGDPAKRSQLTLRTALLANLEDSGNDAWTTLSGIYSVEWQPLRLGADTILIAQIDATSFVAAWAEGDFIFTCQGENLNRWDFTHRIVYDLIDITEHYYSADE